MSEETLFHDALAKSPAERTAFLDHACAGQPELRQAVEALLVAHAASGSLLNQPAVDPNLTGAYTPPPQRATGVHVPHDVQPGYAIAGRYTLEQKIGEGGMGEVWVAKQTEPVKRKVALKLIKAGMDSKAILQRFEAERQALALMDHPHIAKVLDGGLTQDRHPFFVMELVNGLPLNKFCDEAKLTPKQRLELFVPICQAVQHAHQKGIIHRDLKPGNILVTLIDGKPVPKIIDFGVAKATAGKLTDDSLSTQFGAVVGTLEYMAPEQAGYAGEDIDTRADIYSLGVILYEMLTGLRPLDSKRLQKAALTEMIRIIKEEEPSKPSTRLSTDESLPSLAAVRQTEPKKLMAMLRGELDWVVMKCLEKQRDRRYETANGLARDIQRFLADEPVEARPPSTGYRLQKFIRRHKGQVVAVSLVALALVGGMVGTSLGLVQANRSAEAERLAKLDAQAAAKAEKAAKDDADRKRQEALTNLAFAKKGNAILGAVFTGLDPKQKYATVAELRNALRDNLNKAVKELRDSAIGDPEEVAAMQTTLGRSLLALGEANVAIEVFQRARATRQATLGPDDLLTLASMSDLALAYEDAGKLNLALSLHEETLRHIEAKLGSEHPNTLSSMNNLAAAYLRAGKLDKGLPLAERTFQLQKAKLGPDHPDTLASMNNLASVYEQAGKLDLALPLYEETFKLFQVKFGPDHPDTLASMNNLAGAYMAAGKLDKGLPLAERTLQLQKARLGPDHPQTLATMIHLAVQYALAGKQNKVVPLLEESFAIQKVKLGADHPDTLKNMSNLAMAYLNAGRLDKAVPLLEEALQLRKTKLGPDHPDTLVAMHGLATACHKAGKLDQAVSLFEETLKLRQAHLPPGHPDTLTTMNGLAGAYQDASKLNLALPLFEETLKLRTAKLGPEHPDTIASMNNLALAYGDAGQVDLALPLFEKTFALQKAKLGPEHPNTLATMDGLAGTYMAAGKLDQSLPLLEETLKLRTAKLGPDHPDTLNSMNNLATAYWSVKRFDKSIPLFEETLKAKLTKLGRNHLNTLITLGNLGGNYKDAGRLAEAIPLLEEAYRAAQKYPTLQTAGKTLLEAYAQAGEKAKADQLLPQLLATARKRLPKDSPQLAGELASLGLTLLQANAFAAAEPLLRECLAIRAKTQPDTWTTFNTKSLLGGALSGQKKYAEAEPLLVQGYEAMKKQETKIPPPSKVRLTEALERLVQFYEATGKKDKAAKWRKELEATSVKSK